MNIAQTILCVADLMDDHGWNVETSQACFHPVLVRRITDLYLAGNPDNDKWVWTSTPDGCATVSCAYHLLRCSVQPKHDKWPRRKAMWKVKVYPKVKIFLWKWLWNRLPASDYIASIIHSQTMLCPICKVCDEPARHILFQCRFVGYGLG